MVLQILPRKIRSIPEISFKVRSNAEYKSENTIHYKEMVFNLDLKVLSELVDPTAGERVPDIGTNNTKCSLT